MRKVKMVVREAGPFNAKPLGITCSCLLTVGFKRGAGFARIETTETKRSRTLNATIAYETTTQGGFLERHGEILDHYLYVKISTSRKLRKENKVVAPTRFKPFKDWVGIH